MKLKTILALMCVILSLSGCQKIMFGVVLPILDENQRQARREVRNSIYHASLASVFPDQEVRKLAGAAGRGWVHEIDRLVEAGVDVNSTGRDGATPLFWALRKGNLKGFERLIQLGADPELTFDPGGETMIHITAYDGLHDFLKTVLEHGGNPNLVMPSESSIYYGEQPLHIARTPEVVETLLKYGANPDALSKGYEDIQIILHTPLTANSAVRNYQVVLALLNGGADYNLADSEGRTMVDLIADNLRRGLHTPAQMNHLEPVRAWLAEKGIDIPE